MTTRQRVSLEPGFVLHTWPYRDSSLILDIITRDYGRVALVARGARREKSRLRPILRPFVELDMSWSSATELGNLNSAEVHTEIGSLASDATMSGFYINELLMRLLQKNDPHPELYEHYRQALSGLSSDTRPARALRLFEKRLLDSLGYGLTLDHDIVTNEKLVPDREYEFRLEQGPVAVGTRSRGQFVFSGASLLALASETLDDPKSLSDAKKLLRAALEVYLGDRPLKSRQVMRDMRSRL